MVLVVPACASNERAVSLLECRYLSIIGLPEHDGIIQCEYFGLPISSSACIVSGASLVFSQLESRGGRCRLSDQLVESRDDQPMSLSAKTDGDSVKLPS